MQKIPVLGDYWKNREIPASDNVSAPRATVMEGEDGANHWTAFLNAFRLRRYPFVEYGMGERARDRLMEETGWGVRTSVFCLVRNIKVSSALVPGFISQDLKEEGIERERHPLDEESHCHRHHQISAKPGPFHTRLTLRSA